MRDVGENRRVRLDDVAHEVRPGSADQDRRDEVAKGHWEFNIAGGSTDIMRTLNAVRERTNATLVVKRGPMGCAVIEGATVVITDRDRAGGRRAASPPT